ncbi:MAG: hypothetical protein JWP37_4192 [Mucilaginibacter sp.]|jgi:hypothetical protein|nr:hypothetical protein [Mucilaginibacter sp.]
MVFTNYGDANLYGEALTHVAVTSWNPDEDIPVEGDWDDEDDEDFDDRAQDLDDLHEIQVDEDLGEPDPEDDDHLPEEEEDEDE